MKIKKNSRFGDPSWRGRLFESSSCALARYVWLFNLLTIGLNIALAKFQEIQSSLLKAQRQARDLQSENSILETRAAEALDQLEMAALDREVAEEKAEAAEADIVKLGEKVAELEMEVALLKEENGQYRSALILTTINCL